MPRSEIQTLRDIPNIGEAVEKALNLLGIKDPVDLVGKDPYKMYSELCDVMATRVDPCVIDVFLSAVRYMEGEPPRRWWEFTAERKERMGEVGE